MESNNSSTTNNTIGGQSTTTNTAESPSSNTKSRSNQNPIVNEAEMFSKLIENNLSKRKKSSKSKKINSNMSYNKNLDVWLENSLKGCEVNGLDNVYDYTTNTAYQNLLLNNLSTLQRNTNITDSLSLPPQINAFDLPHSSSYLSQQPSQHQSPQHINYIPRPDHNMSSYNDFVSLPPFLMHRMQNMDKKPNSDRSEEHNLSDPNLSASSNTSSTDTNKMNPEKLTESNGNNVDNSAILLTLLKQINLLHETNTKICKNLHDTKVEMDSLKHTPNWNYRHRRDSVSGLSSTSQPIGYPIGTHSPAPTYHSQGSYAPGMVTDVIREIREASRIREDALLNRVKSMIDEKSWSLNESNSRIIRDMEDMKLQIQQMKYESKQTIERFSHLEDEIKSLKLLLSHAINSNLLQQQHHQNVTIERDIMKSPSVRINDNSNKSRRNSLNLNYAAVLSNNNDFNSLDDIDEVKLNPTNVYGVLYTDDNKHHKLTIPNVNNSNNGKKFISSPQHNNNNKKIMRSSIHGEDIAEQRQNEGDEQLMQLEKDTLELRRELQDAVAGRKHAENRIMSLENMVTTLQSRVINPVNGVGITGRQIDSNNHHINVHLLNDNPNTNKRHSLTISPKPQKAAQIQNVSPKNLQQSSTSNSICLSGPVTDL